MTAGTHVAVRAGVLIGVIAIIVLFVAISVVWMRRAQHARRTPHHRTASQPDSVAMAYSKAAHDLTPVQSPKPLPRLYDAGNFSVTSRPYDFGTQEPDGTALPPMHSTYTASLVFDEPVVRGRAAAGSRLTPRIARGLRLVNGDWDETKPPQSFGRSELHGLVQLVTSAPSHPGVTVQDYPAEGLELSPGVFTSLRLSPPPKTPTHPLLGGTKPSRHDQLGITFAFPSPPPSPNGSIMATISDFSLSSSSSDGAGEESLIWSEVFSLDDYDTEEEVVTRSRRVSVAVRDQLPSPPPTPTPIVLFTPPSPPNAMILAPGSQTVQVDTERLHVWKSAVKKVRTDSDSGEPTTADIFAAGHDWHNSYNISRDVNVSLATFTLAHEQAKAARARRGTRGKPYRKSTVGPNFREDSPPAYQSLGYEIQSRLARKRAPSLSEDIPTSRDKPAERFLLHRIASIVKPRPALENFEPLLCRKVDISKLQAQRLVLGFQARVILPDSASLGDQHHDPTSFRRHAAALDAPVENVGRQDGECIDEAAVMGLAV